MAPLTVSKLSSEDRSEHGGAGEVVLVAGRFTVTAARTTPCGPVSPAAEKGRLIEVVTSVAILNVVAVPMVAPAALRKATVPSHDAAVPA